MGFLDNTGLQRLWNKIKALVGNKQDKLDTYFDLNVTFEGDLDFAFYSLPNEVATNIDVTRPMILELEDTESGNIGKVNIYPYISPTGDIVQYRSQQSGSGDFDVVIDGLYIKQNEAIDGTCHLDTQLEIHTNYMTGKLYCFTTAFSQNAVIGEE